MKAQDVKNICLEERGTYTDNLLVATGTSSTHVQSIADRLVEYLTKAGLVVDSVEGTPNNQWVIVDAGDVVVHIFQEEPRKLYNIEKLYVHDFDTGDFEDDEETDTLNAS
ncbi:MAG TPA: ribosome silencing factor [Nitrospinaceae bacterium]|nr:ribosome silencing factor [Nitrospinaceae bacterium]